MNALRTKSAYMPGGLDRDGHILIVIPVPYELNPWTKNYFEISVKYLLSTLRYVSFILIIRHTNITTN